MSFVKRRRFDVTNSTELLPFCDVQWPGGRGSAFGDGASKYLLPAKCKFGVVVDTPAGDANEIGDRGGLRPVIPCGLPFW